jgi:hypothetical protein
MLKWPIAQMSDPLHLVHTPLGEPGSGRVRYGAAMALHAKGLIPEAALEIYRICSPLDAQDPAPLLRERGLRPLAAPGALRLERLRVEADRYLAALPGPGPAEVRLGLARAIATGDVPLPRPNAVLEAYLGDALGMLGQSHAALATAIAAAAPHLRWITYDRYRPEEIGPAFAAGHAFATLVGEGAPYRAGDFDFGLFLIAPHILYRDHAHPAPELYAPLTGPHGWRFAPGAPLTIKKAHEPVWNDANAPHLTKVGAVPFLCFYGWTRDVESPARVIPADDWAALEALIL